MQINDLRAPSAPFNLTAGSSSTRVAHGQVVEIEEVEGQFIKIPNKGDLRQEDGTRRFLNLETGQVYSCPRNTPVRQVCATLNLEDVTTGGGFGSCD